MKRGRPRSLSEAQIVDAAVVLADSVGLEHVSMRSLALELGVPVMTIYNDVPNKDALHELVTNFVLAPVRVPLADEGTWEERSSLVLVWPAANHDPRAFPHPDDVDLDRPNPRQHVGFGWGRHLCVGAPLARVEAQVASEQLLARTKSFSIEPDATPLRHHRSLMVRRLVELPLVLEPA